MQPVLAFSANEANGKNATKTTIQHEQRTQRQLNPAALYHSVGAAAHRPLGEEGRQHRPVGRDCDCGGSHRLSALSPLASRAAPGHHRARAGDRRRHDRHRRSAHTAQGNRCAGARSDLHRQEGRNLGLRQSRDARAARACAAAGIDVRHPGPRPVPARARDMLAARRHRHQRVDGAAGLGRRLGLCTFVLCRANRGAIGQARDMVGKLRAATAMAAAMAMMRLRIV
jgi:hypothetical protein